MHVAHNDLNMETFRDTTTLMPIKMCTTIDFAETSNFHCDYFCVGRKITVECSYKYIPEKQQFRDGGLRS